MKCKHCGGDGYLVEMLYRTSHQKLYVVYCQEYKCELLPVVADYWCQEDEVYAKCAETWSKANAVEEI